MGFKPTGGSSQTRSVPTSLAEINVTPLVDVMLVLLIVFMISAPLMQQGIQVDLPKANTGTLNEVPDQLVLTVNKSQQIIIAEHTIPSGTLLKKLEAIVAAKPRIEVVIQADHAVSYGFIAQVMAEVKKAGISRVGLATEPGDGSTRL
jgi:biopolymer transport protein TolR